MSEKLMVICDTHFVTYGYPRGYWEECPYCEIDRLKAEVEYWRSQAISYGCGQEVGE